MEPRSTTQKISQFPILAMLMILIPLLLATGCTENPPEPAELHLEGTSWTLTEYVYNGTSRHVLPGTTVTLSFGEGGGISGSAGCNCYFGSYRLNDTTITIGQLGQTEMACLDLDTMDQEWRYLSLLSDAVLVTARDDTLSLADSRGNTILSFERMVPPEPKPLVGTNWTLNCFGTSASVSSVISGTTITAVFDSEGRVTGSAGCNQYFGSYTLEGDSLSIHTIGSTKMNCPGPGIMEQEATYLEYLGRVTGFGINGDSVSLRDEYRRTILVFTAEP